MTSERPPGEDGPDQPDEPGRSDDEAWADIVANYGDRAQVDDDGHRRRRRGADHETDETDETGDPGPGGGRRAPQADVERLRPLFRDPFSPVGAGAPDPLADDEERFVPPEPPPVPTTTPVRTAAWLGLLGVPVLMVLLALLQVRPPTLLVVGLVVWFLGSFGYLVATMRKRADDGWDDGAVV